LGLGVALRIQTERSIALAVAADRAQLDQEATAQAAVHEERARIARELAAYRLIQEALTNARKHAPTSHAQVRLCHELDRLRIEVTDDGGPFGAAGGAARNASGPGHGLIGMRERVQVYEGRLQTGPMPGGGFRVEATLPLSAVSS
jgi:signal transduction histidine kinase